MHQGPDHLSVVDPMVRPPNQPGQRLDQGRVIIDLQPLFLQADPHDLVHQPRRHRVDIVQDVEGAVAADPYGHLPILG